MFLADVPLLESFVYSFSRKDKCSFECNWIARAPLQVFRLDCNSYEIEQLKITHGASERKIINKTSLFDALEKYNRWKNPLLSGEHTTSPQDNVSSLIINRLDYQ